MQKSRIIHGTTLVSLLLIFFNIAEAQVDTTKFNRPEYMAKIQYQDGMSIMGYLHTVNENHLNIYMVNKKITPLGVHLKSDFTRDRRVPLKKYIL